MSQDNRSGWQILWCNYLPPILSPQSHILYQWTTAPLPPSHEFTRPHDDLYKNAGSYVINLLDSTRELRG